MNEMNHLKVESHENDQNLYICRGCLSVDRKLQILNRNIDLYFMLLGPQKSCDDSEYFKVLLCWECIALLKRIRAFQSQIRTAEYKLQNYLQRELFEPRSLEALTSLTITSKYDYDETLEEMLPDIKLELPPIQEDLKNNDVKQELLELVSEDVYDGEETTDYTIDIVKNENERKSKSKDRLSDAITTELDINNIDIYISEVSCTLKEIAMDKKEKKIWFNSTLSTRLKARIKKLISRRNSDIKNSRKNNYNCKECASSQESLEALRSHWDNHRLTMYRCDLCKNLFLLHSVLVQHFKNCHSKLYTCKICSVQFNAIRDYFMHNRQLHKYYACDICAKTFMTKRSIEKHMRFVHLPWLCQSCDRIFPTRQKYRKHMTNHHTQPVAGSALELCYCVECDRQFPHLLAYKNHLRTAVKHNPRKPTSVPCPLCGKVFSRKTYMHNHYQLVHVKKSKHYCELCDKYYITGFSLRQHKQYVHGKSEKPKDKICDICGRGFHTNRTLENHRRTHTGERPYKCTHCPAAFAQITAKKSHERTQHKNIIEN